MAEIYEQLSACAYLESSDQSKLGSGMKGLQSQKNLEINQPPKTISKARGVLSNHDHQKFEQARKPKGKGEDKIKIKIKIKIKYYIIRARISRKSEG